MEPDAPLEHLLQDGTSPVADRRQLEAIVRRSDRRRARLLAGGVALALVVGGGAGWLTSRAGSSGSSDHRVATRGGLAAAAPGGSAASPAIAVGNGSTSWGGATSAGSGPILTKAFNRTTADGVTVRSYLTGAPQAEPNSGCGFLAPQLISEVSTDAAVGQTFAMASDHTAPVVFAGETTLGVAEGAPVWVVSAHVGAGVANVAMVFSDGHTDQMAPVNGWATLAHVAPASAAAGTLSKGTLRALDAGGKVLATAPVDGNQTMPMQPNNGASSNDFCGSSCSVPPAKPAGAQPQVTAGSGAMANLCPLGPPKTAPGAPPAASGSGAASSGSAPAPATVVTPHPVTSQP
jgi:hypothetical protein